MFAGSPFVLRVPIDVSQVPDFAPGGRISVLAWNRHGYQQQQLVTFERKGTVVVTFQLNRAPDSLHVVLGPADAMPFELRNLQTTSIAVSSSTLHASAEVELPVIRITAWDWWWWHHWRQTFCVTGRVEDAGGRPVAGAAVTAFDVDACWWWTAKEHVGSAITESDGSFLIAFTRGCGWEPSWWWATRDWQVDTALAEGITSFVRQYPGLDRIAAMVDSVPNLEIFRPLLHRLPAVTAGTPAQAGSCIDPAGLEQIREPLLEILPRRFPPSVWPWSEWFPWEDCGANLIFRVTRTQGNRTAVLVNEEVANARWDIPASLDVKLTASDETYCGASANWTLVDHLFPIPWGRHKRESSAGVFS
jgi:hypothetical protein